MQDFTLYLNGEVDEQMYKDLVNFYGKVHKYEPSQVTIVLNTFGGDFYQALAIYDYIKCFGPYTKIICNGPVMSSGMIILQAAEERLATPNAQLMIHYGSDANESETDAVQNRKMLTLTKKIISERLKNVSKKTFNTWFRLDSYFNTKRALELGLIDKIVEYNNER